MSADAVCLVYRASKGCAQYAFGSVDALEAWAARHPYRNERLRVMPMANRQFLPEATLPAAEAADYLRKALKEANP